MQRHPLRERLIHDLHARPFITLDAPLSLLHLALVHRDGDRDRDCDRHAAMCRQHGVEMPAGAGNDVRVRIADTWLQREHHAEFTTCTFWRSRPVAEPFRARAAGVERSATRRTAT